MTATNGVGTTIFADGTEYPIVSRNPAIQEAYLEMRKNGQSHNIAELLAFRRSPDIRTDSTYMAGMVTDEDPAARRYRRDAEAAGIDTAGAIYLSKIAEYPGDPKAFVRTRGDIVRRCEELNYDLEIDGRQVVKSRDVPPAPSPGFDPETIADRLEQTFEANPGLEADCAAKPELFKEKWHEASESLKPDWA